MNCILSPPRAPSELLRLDSFRTLSRLLLVVEFKPWFGREGTLQRARPGVSHTVGVFLAWGAIMDALDLLSPPYHHIAFEFELSMDERVAFFTKFIERVRLLEIQGLLPYGEVLRVDDMFGRSNAGFARVSLWFIYTMPLSLHATGVEKQYRVFCAHCKSPIQDYSSFLTGRNISDKLLYKIYGH